MIPLSSTANPPLDFDLSIGENNKKAKIPTSKIGWMHTVADQDGAKFDLTIKDALGRIKYQKKDCHSNTKQFGELINQPTLIGEEVEISLENVRGAKKIQVFLN